MRLLFILSLLLFVSCLEEGSPFEPKYDQMIVITEDGRILKLKYYMGGEGSQYTECYTISEVDPAEIATIERLQNIHKGAKYLDE